MVTAIDSSNSEHPPVVMGEDASALSQHVSPIMKAERHIPDHIPISGRFDQYRSSYWSALIAVFPMRYAVRAITRSLKWMNEENKSFNQKHFYSAISGALVSAVTLYYAWSTWKDMKSIFQETLSWEFDKKPEDVGFMDFWNSKNAIVQNTISNFTKYNLRRLAVNSSFFAPFIAKPFLSEKFANDMHPETGVDVGVAANGIYLFRDVLSRRITPFEEIQSLIDRKINQAEHFADMITGKELLDIYERNANLGLTKSFLTQRGTPAWERSMGLFERMADLINQSYRSTAPREKASFSFSEFIHLVGNGLLDPENLEKSYAYVEIANRYDIHAFRKAQQEFAEGKSVTEVLTKFKIAPPKTLEVQSDTSSSFSSSLANLSQAVDDKNQSSRIEKPPATHLARIEKQRAENAAAVSTPTV